MKTITNTKAGMVSIPGAFLVQGENQLADKVWDDVKEHPSVKKMLKDKVLVEGKATTEVKVEAKPEVKAKVEQEDVTKKKK